MFKRRQYSVVAPIAFIYCYFLLQYTTPGKMATIIIYCSFVFLQITPCCLILKLKFKRIFPMNEATRANLQANKRILKWQPFWNEILLTAQFLYPIISQCHLLIHWCTDCFLFWGSGNGHNLCVPWGYSRKTYTKNEEIIILKSWIKHMVIPENVHQIHRTDTHFMLMFWVLAFQFIQLWRGHD